MAGYGLDGYGIFPYGGSKTIPIPIPVFSEPPIISSDLTAPATLASISQVDKISVDLTAPASLSSIFSPDRVSNITRVDLPPIITPK